MDITIHNGKLMDSNENPIVPIPKPGTIENAKLWQNRVTCTACHGTGIIKVNKPKRMYITLEEKLSGLPPKVYDHYVPETCSCSLLLSGLEVGYTHFCPETNELYQLQTSHKD